MPFRDYDDPKLFSKCVAAVTLKAEPQGYISDCLSDPDLHVTVGLGSKKGQRQKLAAWLSIDELEAIPWASNIRAAHLLSDHLEGSRGLFELTRIEDLTINVIGTNFHDDDVMVFTNAVENLPKLKRLRLYVDRAALAQSGRIFVWRSSGFSLEVLASGPDRRHGRRQLPTQSPKD